MELQRLWETRVRAARQLYEEHQRELDRLVAESGGGLPESLKSSELIREARKRESLALGEYLRTLRIYTDLIVHGKLSNELDS